MSKEQQIRNSFIYLLPVIVTNALPLVTLPVFTRFLTREDYGALALATIYGLFISGLSNFGLLLTYERNFFESQETDHTSRLLYSILIFVLMVFSFCLLLTWVFRIPLATWIVGGPLQCNLLFWTTAANGLSTIKGYYLTYFKNMEDAGSFVRFSIYESLLSVTASLILVVYLNVGVIGLVGGQFIGSLILFLALTRRFLKKLPLKLDNRVLREALKFSFPLTPNIVFKVIGSQFDKYMIGLLSTLGGVGVYSIGQKIANIVFTYMTSIENVFLPQVYKRMFNHDNKRRESIGSYLTPFAYISIFVALLIALFAEEIIQILLPEQFHEAIDIVIILSLIYATYFFGKQPQLLYAKKTFISSTLTFVRIALNIAINIPFIFKWGALGAAYGVLTAGLVSGAIHFVVSQHYYRIEYDYKSLCAIFLTLFVAAGLLLFMRYIAIDYLTRLLFKTFCISFYVLIGIRIRVITAQNIGYAKSLLHLNNGNNVNIS
jgi:O-antigen/teichoic acid export membrane protein